MKASAFRRWPVAGAYSPEQTTRLTGGSDFLIFSINLQYLMWRFKGIEKDFSYPNGAFYVFSDSINDAIQSILNGDKKAH